MADDADPMIAALASLLLVSPQVDRNVLVNGDFESGLSSWKTEGDVRVEGGVLRLGPGKGAARQRYRVPGLRILLFEAALKPSSPQVQTRVRLQCLDAQNRPLMDVQGFPDPKKPAGIYLKTHARTASVLVSIEKTSEGGEVVADKARLLDDDREKTERRPLVDLDAAVRPFWKGGRIEDESVLLLSETGGTPKGRLLFRPTRILSVRDATLGRTYREGRDYALDANVLSAVEGSSIPTFSDTDFAKGEFPWTVLERKHVFVIYEHRGSWTDAVPTYAGDALPETVERLKAKRPLTIVAHGDSITLGMSASGYKELPPYLPPWPTLFVHALRKNSGNGRIELFNTALGGMNSYWGRDTAKDAVASLDPDLVLLAFGMNDFWSISPSEFRQNVETTIATIRARRPKCEFLLVAPMRFDPAYTADPTYVGNLVGYAEELRKLSAPGIAVLDMTALSGALYEAKGAKSLVTDPMHPNDFLNRIYAQAAAATLIRP